MKTLIALALLAWASPSATAANDWGKPNGLYERLGGTYAIAAVVDDFVERLWVDPVLNANPAIAAARTRVPKPGLKYQITALVCEVTGGAEKYTGRSMKEAHAHLHIVEKEWAAMAADMKASLDKFHVGAGEQDELFKIIGTTKADIVTGK